MNSLPTHPLPIIFKNAFSKLLGTLSPQKEGSLFQIKSGSR